MTTSKKIREWYEVSQGFLLDGPPKRRDGYEATMFYNRCELKQRPSGRLVIRRHLGVETIEAPSKELMEAKMADYLQRDDVRLLAKGLEVNQKTLFPLEQIDPSVELVEGTDTELYDVNKDCLYGD